MATTKSGGTAKNLRDSNPKYLGIKRGDGARVAVGEIIVRQRGTTVVPGKNTALGKDHTIFAKVTGVVHFRSLRKVNFDGRSRRRPIVEVV